MPLFFTGDELGNIKSLRVSPGVPSELTLLNSNSAKSSVAALSVSAGSTSKSVVAAYADGSVTTFDLQDDNELRISEQWKETRLKADQSYVGLQATDRGVYTCTSNGALRLVPAGAKEKRPILGCLPSRLCAWRIDSGQTTFAYGGDEVEPSVWSTEKALTAEPASSSDSSCTKRKRDALFPGEIWRAKNIQNDGLGLRQPVRITSLAYLSTSTTLPNLLTGTQFGDLRRYDTKAARRPVSNWKGVGKVGGINVIEKGLAEHEVFVSDRGSNLFALDMRNGRVIYSYKGFTMIVHIGLHLLNGLLGLSGAVTSIAPSPSILVSTALDRYCRIHTSFPPPAEAGQSQDNKGQVMEKLFMTSVPTVVAWDGVHSATLNPEPVADDDDVWEEMENVEDSDDESKGRKRRRNAE
ncbi:hypothetical protein DFH06DRAFT_1157559 [Mycena polygramma]|nr:hypothetical protein DFH06DRAFT_1157559 [Mycena polygramma]